MEDGLKAVPVLWSFSEALMDKQHTLNKYHALLTKAIAEQDLASIAVHKQLIKHVRVDMEDYAKQMRQPATLIQRDHKS